MNVTVKMVFQITFSMIALLILQQCNPVKQKSVLDEQKPQAAELYTKIQPRYDRYINSDFVFQKLSDIDHEISPIIKAAHNHWDCHDYRKAINSFKSFLKYQNEFANTTDLIEAYISLADIYQHQLFLTDSAFYYVNKAYSYTEKKGSHPCHRIRVLYNLSYAYWSRRDHVNSLLTILLAKSLYNEHSCNNPNLLALLHGQHSHTLRKFEKYKTASDVLDTALALKKLFPISQHVMEYLYEHKLYTTLATRDSIKYVNIIEDFKKSYGPTEYIDYDVHLGYFYASFGNADSSIKHFNRYVSGLNKSRKKNKFYIDLTHFQLAQQYAKQRQFNQAEQSIYNGYALVRDICPTRINTLDEFLNESSSERDHISIPILGNLGKIFIKKYRITNDYADLNNAIKAFRAQDSLLFEKTQGLEDEHIHRFEWILHQDYAYALEALYELYIINDNETVISEAHKFIDRAKAVNFRKVKTISDNELYDLNTTQKALNNYKQRLIHESQSLSLQELQNANHIAQKLKTYSNYLNKSDTTIPNLLYNLPSLEKIEELSVLNNEVYVEFFDTENALYIVSVTPDGQKIFYKSNIIDTTYFNTLVRIEKQLYSVPHPYLKQNNKQIIEDLHRAYNIIVHPWIKDITEDNQINIVAVPDGRVAKIPLGILIESIDSNQYDYRYQEYLIKSKSIKYLYSSSSYGLSVKTKKITQKPRVLGFSYSSPLGVRQSAIRIQQPFHIELWWGAKELKTLSTQTDKRSRFYYGEKASINTFISQAKKPYDIIHLASHGKNSQVQNELSRIYFKKGYDSIDSLNQIEIERLQINVPLIILNTCHSGAGPYVEGEGTISIARSFLQNPNVQSVISNLWILNDKTSADVMNLFYEEVHPNLYYQSLQWAVSEYIDTCNNSEEANPRNWGGLILYESSSKPIL